LSEKQKLGEKIIFIKAIPIIYPERNVARQIQVEMWLDLTQAIKELGLKPKPKLDYLV
jgi:hypothetical protein